MLLEKQDRKYNLLFYGIPEEPGEKLYDKMRGYFVNDLGIDAERAQKIYSQMATDILQEVLVQIQSFFGSLVSMTES